MVIEGSFLNYVSKRIQKSFFPLPPSQAMHHANTSCGGRGKSYLGTLSTLTASVQYNEKQ